MTDTTLKVGTPVGYGVRHQEGGYSESGHVVPQRKYRGWNRELKDEAKKIVARHFVAALKARATGATP